MNRDGRVAFEAHPPERRRRSTVLMAHGCCCCCCCLHTIGGIAGAVWGGIRRQAPDPETLTTQAQVDREEQLKKALQLTVRTYWLALALVAAVSTAAIIVGNPREPAIGPILIAIFLPAGQLLASIATAIAIRMKDPVRKSDAYRILGRITLFAFLGGILGIVGLVITGLTMNLIR